MQQSKSPKPSEAAAQQNADPVPAGGGARTRALARQAEGFKNQEALFSPEGAAATPRVQADANGAPSEKLGSSAIGQDDAPAQSGGAQSDVEEEGVPKAQIEASEHLSPIRLELMKQFELLEGKGVGMKEFDAICSESTWLKKKGEEDEARGKAQAEYDKKLAEYAALPEDVRKKTPEPRKNVVPVYTTCIDTMGFIARAAWKASGMAVKRVEGQSYDQFAFGAEAREKASRIDAWVEAGPGSGKVPKPGDMLMLEKAGKKLDDLALEGRGLDLNAEAKEKKLRKELSNLEAASQSANAAFAQACKAKAQDVQAALAKLKTDLEAAKAKLSTKLAEAQAGVGKRVEGGAKLEFSHVGFFKSSEPEIGPDGQPTGREVWTTFDGGQSQIANAVGGQGAKSGKRVYDPATNFIAGEASQGGAPRWLAGWVDVDRMAKQSGAV